MPKRIYGSLQTSFRVWCKLWTCHVPWTGWRTYKYISQCEVVSLRRESEHTWCTIRLVVVQKWISKALVREPWRRSQVRFWLSFDSSRIFYDFHLAWDRFCQFICYSVSNGKRVWWWTTKNLIENLGGEIYACSCWCFASTLFARWMSQHRFEGARRIVTSETEINKYAPSESSFFCIYINKFPLLKARLCVVVRRLLP